MSGEVRSRNKVNVVLLLVCLISVGVIGHLLGSNSPGYARVFGNWLGAMMIGYVIAWPFTRAPEKKEKRGTITLALSLIFLLLANYQKIQDVSDIRAGLSAVRDTVSHRDLIKKLEDNEQNRTLEAMRIANEASENSTNEIIYLFQNLKSPVLETPVSFDKARYDDLVRYRQELKNAHGRALEAIEKVRFIHAREREIVADKIKPLRFQPEFENGLIKGLVRRNNDYGGYFIKLLKAKSVEFELSYQMLSVLISEHGKFSVSQDGTYLFQNVSVVDGFNDIYVALIANQENLIRIEKEGAGLDARYQDKFHEVIKRKF
tara:strand:- start:647 stop:1600 length:954 start_codon:yes stop_codon:yes gene_type:complete